MKANIALPHLRIFIFIAGMSALLFLLPDIYARHCTTAAFSNQDQAAIIKAAEDGIAKAEKDFVAASELDEYLRRNTLEITKKSHTISLDDYTNLEEIRKVAAELHRERATHLDTVELKKDALDASVVTLTTAKTNLENLSEQTDDVKKAIEKVKEELVRVGKKPALEDSEAKLKAELNTVYGITKGLVTEANELLVVLKDKTQARKESDLFFAIPRAFPQYAEMIRFQGKLLEEGGEPRQKFLVRLGNAIKNIAGEPDTDSNPATSIDELQKNIKDIFDNVGPCIASLDAIIKKKHKEIGALVPLLAEKPPIYEAQAIATVADGERIIKGADSFEIAWIDLQPQLEAAGFDSQAQKAALGMVKISEFDLTRAVFSLRGILAGDYSQFITERIRLYYFTDIPRLIKTLNDTAYLKGGDETARARANNLSQQLNEAEVEFRVATAALEKFKSRARVIEDQLADAENDKLSAETLFQATSRRLARLEARPEGEIPERDLERAKTEQAARKADRDQAAERHQQLTDEQTGLPAKLREAKARVEEAQTDLERLTEKVLQTARAESVAFAQARDNAPFWYAAPLATHTDPAKRVEITSSTNGENIIFVRGARKDVDEVKRIVAKLDEPAPQARMTLWKLELSSDATKDGTKKFNEGLKVIEGELARARAEIATSLSLLLDCINREVNHIAKEQVGILNADDARYQIYSKQVLIELGFDLENLVGENGPRVLGLKDPAGATTLNEALVVLLLSNYISREKIWNAFKNQLSNKLKPANIDSQDQQLVKGAGQRKSDKLGQKLEKECGTPSDIIFDRLDKALGLDLNIKNTEDKNKSAETEFTRQQAELVYAIRAKIIQRHLLRINEVNDSLKLAVRGNNYNKYLDAQQKKKNDKNYKFSSTELLAQDSWAKLLPFLNLLYKEFGINPNLFTGGSARLREGDNNTFKIELTGATPPVTKTYSFKSTSARIAAADGMLDNYIKAFEDDLEANFIGPMLCRVRNKLEGSKGVGVGVVQRTSLLATNRLAARVDPRASAELAIGEKQDLLQAIQQISQLVTSAQAGGPLGLFGAFQAQSRNDTGLREIYGITTGNTFQVTPIFDPTGQALRFRFDFVGATRIREPNGTSNPRLSQIERHTVNTEVQLSNMEIREVSRFEANAQLGLPTRYWGGLPILKDIPGVRSIPFIGWFIRYGGREAVSQQSIIFAQTVMSPTIGDLLELLGGSPLPQVESGQSDR